MKQWKHLLKSLIKIHINQMNCPPDVYLDTKYSHFSIKYFIVIITTTSTTNMSLALPSSVYSGDYPARYSPILHTLNDRLLCCCVFLFLPGLFPQVQLSLCEGWWSPISDQLRTLGTYKNEQIFKRSNSKCRGTRSSSNSYNGASSVLPTILQRTLLCL